MKKEDQIKMLLHPEEYSDEQMDQMLDETGIAVPDVESEWRRLRRGRQRPSLRWAAMFVGVLMLSGIAYAAIVVSGELRTKSEESVSVTPPPVKKETTSADTSLYIHHSSIPESKTFENVPLKDITKELAEAYHVDIDIKNDEAAALRLYYPWNPAMPLAQVVEELNRFEKVRLAINDSTLVIE